MSRIAASATHSAFLQDRRIAHGTLAEVAVRAAAALGPDVPDHEVLIFDDATGEQIDLDLRGTPDDIRRRLAISHPEPDATPAPEPEAAPMPRGPGRPRLGVVAREITLLPRHWEWLAQQPGGASVTLRKLVDEARRTYALQEQVRRAQDAACRFMTVMAGNRPHFEDAVRALYARQAEVFDTLTLSWPADIRAHARGLAAPALDAADTA